MGIEPPFLYDPPSKWNDIGLKKPFNPKAVSDAAQAPQIPKTRREGPLLNFNVHPDSYLILPYGNVGGKSSMSRHTKTNVKVARGIQLIFRGGELLATLALLVCVICLRNLDSNASWCFRIPPCVGLVHTLYGTYHHIRSATTKPPATTASYNFVAAGLDASLIPFYAFMCLLCSNQLNAPSLGWTTVFADAVKDRNIVNITFILTIVNASMHWLSLLLCLFLAVIFRKITRLPPDLNPLESNLTTRHKKKTSEASSHRWSKSTTFADSEATDSPRHSVAAPRTIPFLHTRTGSMATDDAASNRFSRTDLPSQLQDAMSKRSSRTDLARSLPKRASRAEVLSKETIMRNSRETLSSENWYSYLGAKNEGNENEARTSTMLSDYTKKSDPSIYHSVAEDEDDADDRQSQEMDLGDALNVHIHEINNEPDRTSRWEEDVSDTESEVSRPSTSGTVETYPATRKLGFNPLGLNPPTPNPEVQDVRRASPVSVIVRPSSGPKAKYYGDLRAATPPAFGPKKGEVIDLTIDDDDRGTRVVSTGSEIFNEKGGRRREVSGKIAEEGRGGKESNAWWTAARRTLSGRRIRDE